MESTRGPARLVPPGRILARELEARGWQQKDLAAIMGRPEQAISEIINDKKQITAETARELAAAFGTLADFWMNLEANYRLQLAERQAKEDEISRAAALYEQLPCYGELVKRGWLSLRETLAEREQDVCRFLGIASIGDPVPLAMAARHSAHGVPARAAEIAWARRVVQVIEGQEVGAYDPAAADELIAALLAHTLTPEDVAAVPPLLLRAGIHFAVVPHLPKTYLDGAAFWHEGHPVVALTLHYDRLDHFWFTLLHELAHILLGHQGVFFDSLADRDEQDDIEREANRVAADWLLDPIAYAAFVAQGVFEAPEVRCFAEAQGRHPSIVAGRLRYDGLLGYHRLTGLSVHVAEQLQPEMWQTSQASSGAPKATANPASAC